MAKQNMIRSHSERSRKAEELRQKLPVRASIFDKEAITEFLLLEDLVNLYKTLMELEEGRTTTTRQGEMARTRSIAAYAALIKVFKAAQEICETEIYGGNFKAVWGAIPERALMKAANKVKLMPQMRMIATRMLDGLSRNMMLAASEAMALDDDADMIEINENNTRKIKGLPSASDIEAIIREVELAIPDVVAAKRSARKNINPNV